MKNKVFDLECMIGGSTFGGKPCKRISEQMKEILESNHNYDFVAMVYHEDKNVIKFERASLIVKVNK